MGVKRTQKILPSSLHKKAKRASSHEIDDTKRKPVERERRAPRKNYYESDKDYENNTDADSDFEVEPTQKIKQNKRKKNSEFDSESNSNEEEEEEGEDEILTKPKIVRKQRHIKKDKMKNKIPTAKKRKSKKNSSDSGNSSDANNECTRNKNYQPLLSSEGSDSDTPLEKSYPKTSNLLESKQSHETNELKEPVTSLRLMNKSIHANKDVLDKNELSIKINCKENKDYIWEGENLEDSNEEETKIEVKTEPDDQLVAVKVKKYSKASAKETQDARKSAVIKKCKTRSKAAKSEGNSKLKETPKIKETKKSSKPRSTKNTATKMGMTSSKIKDLDDVSAVLMQFEGKTSKDKILSDSEGSSADAEESSESDWEEVKDDPSVPSTSSGQPQQAIEITLEQKQFGKKKKNVRKFDWKAFFQRQMNVFHRDLQIAKHKVHLLCLVGHGMVLNKLCCHPILKALSLSLLPSLDKPDFTVGRIKSILTAFSTRVKIKTQENDAEAPTFLSIIKAFFICEANGTKEYTMMFVMALRSLGLRVRFVMSFHPLPLKKPKEEKKKTQNIKTKYTQKEKIVVKKNDNSQKGKITKSKSKEIKKSKTVKSNQKKVPAEEKHNQIDDSSLAKRNRPSRKKLQNISYKESDGSDFEEVSDKKRKTNKKTLASKLSEKMSSSSSSVSSEDFEENSIMFTTPKRTGAKPGHKIISSSSSNNSFTSNQSDVTETWIEVYLEKEKRWLSVDCVNMVFDDLSHFENLDFRPFSYILTFDNDGYLKDVTPRYSSQWMLKTRKLRVQEEWWEKTMKPYLNQNEDNKIEDSQIQDNLLKQPLPKTISEYKNHPLYILKRHLLKFEAIYPNSAVPMGYIRNEPVYARECVHQLHSRETWMKEGRNVKVGEEPYKMVKSRPKWNKPKENPDIPDLPVFGRWQTEVYVPPPAVDGKIPRNEYGNVELFQPTMLPAGTVHLKEPGLNKIARKLGFDCAAAMIGWDFHGGSCHPVFDGWIVCVEHKDMILKEWEKDQERAQIREIEKREKRIYGNWKKLIRGLLIRERLKKKYDLMEPEIVDDEQEEANDTQSSWPRKEGKKSKVKTKEKS